MTTRGREPDATAEDRFLTELYPQITEHLAAQYAKDYDVEAGQARFTAWLDKHTVQPRGAGGDDDPEPDLGAAVFLRRTRRGGPRRDLLRLQRRRRAAAAALAAEDHRIGRDRDPAQAAHRQTLTLAAAGTSAADDHLARSQRRLEREVWRIDRMRARERQLIVRARRQEDGLVGDPDGGQARLMQLVDDQWELRDLIKREVAAGSLKHQRLPGWIRRMPMLVLLADFSLLLYFFSEITNVDWSKPMSASLVFAVLLATMMTALSYGFLGLTGYRLRAHKDHSGSIPLDELDGFTKIVCGAAAAGIAVIPALMFVRMRSVVLYALGPHALVTALVVALCLAVSSALANFLFIAVRAFDGSDQMAHLEALSAAISGPLSKAHQMRKKAELMPHRVAVRQRRAHRAAMLAVTAAERYRTAADWLIDAARDEHRQGTGPYSTTTDPDEHGQAAGSPQPDLRSLHIILRHIDTWAADNPGESEALISVPAAPDERPGTTPPGFPGDGSVVSHTDSVSLRFNG